MKKIRNSIFETNSSSTHAIVVPRSDDGTIDLYPSWETCNLEFGRQTYRILETWDLKLSYVYIILLDISTNHLNIVSPNPDLNDFKSRVIKIHNNLVKINNFKIDYDDVTPEHIFKVLDYINDNSAKSTEETEKLLREVPNIFSKILNGLSSAFVDHVEYFMLFKDEDVRVLKPCYNFIEKLLSDDKYLEKFLFNEESYITIGGDEYRGYNIKTVGFECDYKYEDDFEKRLKEYSENYEVYLKGN